MKITTSRRSQLRRTLAIAAAATATLASVAACGGGDSDAAASSSSTGGTTHVKVLLSPVYFESVYIAQDKGYFKDAGLDVEVAEGGTADAQIPQLLNGQAQIGMTAATAVISANATNIPVTITLGDVNAAKTTPLTSGILVPAASPIKSYADLAGKTVGLQSLKDTTQLALMVAVAEAGADPTTIKFVNLPLPTLNDAVQKGTVDAIYNIGAFYPVGVQAGLRELGSPTADALLGAPSVVFATSKQYAKEHADTVKKFNTAMTKAYDDAAADPNLVRQQTIKYTKQDPNYINSAPVTAVSPTIDRKVVQKMIDASTKYDFIDKSVKVDDVVSDLAPKA